MEGQGTLLDKILVLSYFIIVTVIGFAYSRRYKKDTAKEFVTGGRHLKWWQTGLTLIAMMIDPGIMGFAALGFLWGYYIIQWNAVNVWVTSWFSGLFFIAIYWRSKIITTPEYLDKRFNSVTRAFFSLIMISTMVGMLVYAVYMGALLLQEFVGWHLWFSICLIAGVAGFYVILGGVRTMLALDIFQGALLMITLFALGITGFVKLGGLSGFQQLEVVGNAGTPIKSLIPPLDFNLFTDTMYPLPAVPTYCVIAGISWIVCNFSTAQRLLASKDESHAQKALILTGVFNVILMLLAYSAGVAMRALQPDVMPDKAFITLLFDTFPTGVTGLLIVGLMAALLSTIDGLISASGTLFTQDIYLRFFARRAQGQASKNVIRIVEFIVILLIFVFIKFFMGEGKDDSAFAVLQRFLGNVLGILIAIYGLGIFSKRTTSWASFIGMIAGVLLSTILSFIIPKFTSFPTVNFAHVGTISFLTVIIVGIIGCKFEKPKSEAELENLTIWTLPDVKGPWIGLKSWPGLWKWAIALPATWLVICLLWELYMSS
ncbi:MAG: sodium/solute symporter [Planctomycetota bacterium]|nr:MAG: sodium/solute symporter [Planctomycetota bacterium]